MVKRYGLCLYLSGATAARTGDEMSGPALLLAGLAVTGSASEASSLLAGITVSAAVGGPVFGVILDRSRQPGRLLAAALAAYAAVLAGILVTLGRLPIAVVVTTAVLGGLLGPALSGGWTSQLPRVVAPGTLPRANALDAMTFNVASLIGPVLAGAVAGLTGASVSVVVAFLLIGLAIPAAWFLPANREPSMGGPSVTVLHDLVDGFGAVVRVHPLARATLTSVVSFVGVGMLVTCSPLLGREALGSDGRGVLLLSVLAATSLAANAYLSRRPDRLNPDRLLCVSTLLLAAALLLSATVAPVPLLVAMVVAGLGEGPQLTALFAVRHREAPERSRGQVFTTGASLKITGFAVGAGAAGPIAAWSLPGALVVAAGFEVLAALSFVAITLVGRAARADTSGDPTGTGDGGARGGAVEGATVARRADARPR